MFKPAYIVSDKIVERVPQQILKQSILQSRGFNTDRALDGGYRPPHPRLLKVAFLSQKERGRNGWKCLPAAVGGTSEQGR